MENAQRNERSSPQIDVSLGSFSRIVLTGFMGAGKTTVGQLLAQTMGWTFLDVDQHIERSAGASAQDLFATRGETAFRNLETDALAFALEQSDTIIALGGAAIDAVANRLLLANSVGSRIVFLDAPFATLIDRCLIQERSSRAPYRPLLHQTELAHARYLVRRSLYLDCASFVVAVAERTAQEVAFLIGDTMGVLR